MAFSISPVQTVLWDQIRYTGPTSEFAWVLPVRPGARIELSHDAWFAALEASTQPVITGQPAEPPAGATYSGCALFGCGGGSGSAAGGPPPSPVEVVNQSVVGPYDTVTVRSTDPNALRDWLNQNGYEIPVAFAPTIDAYVGEGFDFLALRLRPLCNEQAMQPVRVITPGADPSLPLRMVAAGVNVNVGITLYVITEGRMHPQNFPDAHVDYSKLSFDLATDTSNYEDLVGQAMQTANGHAWVTEYASHPSLDVGATPSPDNGGPPNPGLADAYLGPCLFPGEGGSSGPTPCPAAPPDAGVDAARDVAVEADIDAEADADIDADIGAEAGTDAGVDANDAGAEDAGLPPAPTGPCGLDDLTVALTGLHPDDVWVTRLRSRLPVDALASGDLVVEPAPSQTPVTNVHQAVGYGSDVLACASVPRSESAAGSWVLIVLTALGTGALLRRRGGRS